MQTQDDTYNGWSNYETWVVNLWLSNEESSYDAARDAVAGGLPAAVAESAMRELVESIIYGYDDAPATLATDLVNHSLARVDWSEILAAFVDCGWTDPDECAMDRERSVAGVSDDIPECAVHGAVQS